MTKGNNDGNKSQGTSTPKQPTPTKQPSKPQERSYGEGGKIPSVTGTGPRVPKK